MKTVPREPASSKHVAEAARLVSGKAEPSAWLLEKLQIGSLILPQLIAQRRDAPSAAALRDRLALVARIAKSLADMLDDADVLLALERCDGKGPVPEAPNGAWLALHDLASVANAASASIAVPQGGRRQVAVELGDSAPQTICAGIIAHTWAATRGKLPGRRNRSAWRACAALWQAAGGDKTGHAGGTPGWEKWLSELADKPFPFPELFDEGFGDRASLFAPNSVPCLTRDNCVTFPVTTARCVRPRDQDGRKRVSHRKADLLATAVAQACADIAGAPPQDTAIAVAEFVTDQQLAKMLGVTTRTTLEWRNSGGGPAFTRIGPRRILYRRRDVERWLAARTFKHRAEEAVAGRSAA